MRLISFACSFLLACSCIGQSGCTEPTACNYHPDPANLVPCEYATCQGCTMPEALNYDLTATIDDRSCILPKPIQSGDMDGNGYVDTADIIWLLGSFGNAPYADWVTVCNVETAGRGRWCDADIPDMPTVGCTDPSKCNFSPYATTDDGSCSDECVVGCTWPCSFNYDPDAWFDDGSCYGLDFELVAWPEDGMVNTTDLLVVIGQFGTAAPDSFTPCK